MIITCINKFRKLLPIECVTNGGVIVTRYTARVKSALPEGFMDEFLTERKELFFLG